LVAAAIPPSLSRHPLLWPVPDRTLLTLRPLQSVWWRTDHRELGSAIENVGREDYFCYSEARRNPWVGKTPCRYCLL